MPERGPAPYQEIKKTPEAREYRDLLTKSLLAARHFDGSEQAYDNLTQTLLIFEEALQTSPSLKSKTPEEREIEAGLTFSPTHPRVINEVLELALEMRNRSLHKALEAPESKESPLFITQIPQVILPPGERSERVMTGEGGKENVIRFEERLKELIAILETLNIFTDDIICTVGARLPSQMRQESYVAVEVPRLSRTVLVNDQVGEATYVLKGYIPKEVYISLSKDELLEKYPAHARKVIRTDASFWQARIASLLTTEEAWIDEGATPKLTKTRRPKVDVRELVHKREHLAALIREAYTPEAWMGLTFKQKSALKIDDLGLAALAKNVFGLEEANPINRHRDHLELGLKIYPESEVIKRALATAERTKEQWAQRIAAEYTPEVWVGLTAKQKSALKIDDFGLKALANSIFGLEGANPVNRHRDHLELGLKIYPESEVIKRALATAERTKEQWAQRIAAEYTPEVWVGLTAKQKSALKIDGLGLIALANNVFGLEGVDPVNRHRDYLELGLKIYPESEVMRAALTAEMNKIETLSSRTKEHWAQRIAAEYTPEEWVGLTNKQKSALKIDGLGLIALANSVFGFEGADPVKRHRDHLELGLKIYPESDEIRHAIEVTDRTPEEWAQRIAAEYTPEEWVGLTAKQKSALKIDGFGLTALTNSVFGIDGANPIDRHRDHLELGLKIYPESEVIKRALATAERTKEHWAQRIAAEYTPEEWVGLTNKQKSALKIDGLGLIALANNVFGFEGADPVKRHRDHLELGLKIFLNNSTIIKAIEGMVE